MPNFDRSGPTGNGAMTGRGLGLCSGNRVPNTGRQGGRGLRYGCGLGYGQGRRSNQGWGRSLGWFSVGYSQDNKTTPAEEIKATLEARKILLQTEINKIEALLSEATGNTSQSTGDEVN